MRLSLTTRIDLKLSGMNDKYPATMYHNQVLTGPMLSHPSPIAKETRFGFRLLLT